MSEKRDSQYRRIQDEENFRVTIARQYAVIFGILLKHKDVDVDTADYLTKLNIYEMFGNDVDLVFGQTRKPFVRESIEQPITIQPIRLFDQDETGEQLEQKIFEFYEDQFYAACDQGNDDYASMRMAINNTLNYFGDVSDLFVDDFSHNDDIPDDFFNDIP